MAIIVCYQTRSHTCNSTSKSNQRHHNHCLCIPGCRLEHPMGMPPPSPSMFLNPDTPVGTGPGQLVGPLGSFFFEKGRAWALIQSMIHRWLYCDGELSWSIELLAKVQKTVCALYIGKWRKQNHNMGAAIIDLSGAYTWPHFSQCNQAILASWQTILASIVPLSAVIMSYFLLLGSKI